MDKNGEKKPRQLILGKVDCIMSREICIQINSIPESHFPIFLSGECYATISVELSWFPIGKEQYSVVPENAH